MRFERSDANSPTWRWAFPSPPPPPPPPPPHSLTRTLSSSSHSHAQFSLQNVETLEIITKLSCQVGFDVYYLLDFVD